MMRKDSFGALPRAGLPAAALLLAGLLAPAPAFPDETAGPVSEVVPLARIVMDRLDKARTHLHEGEDEKAVDEILAGAGALDAVAAASPSAPVKKAVGSALKALPKAGKEESRASLASIGEALARMEENFPGLDPSKRLAGIEAQVEAGRLDEAAAGLRSLQDAVTYFQVDVPVSAARTYILDGLAHLRAGENRRADEELELAQERLQSLVSGEGSRFNRIHRRIRRALAQGPVPHSDGLLETMEAVAAGLAGPAGKDRAGERVALSAKALTRSASDPAGLALGARSLWRLCFGLAHWDAELISLGLKDLSRERDVLDDLIQAKLHLLYAEHKGSGSENREAVLVEVQAARRAVQHAKKKLAGQREVSTGLLLEEIERLEASLGRGETPKNGVYEDLRAGLREVIRDSALPLGEWNPEAAAESGARAGRDGR